MRLTDTPQSGTLVEYNYQSLLCHWNNVLNVLEGNNLTNIHSLIQCHVYTQKLSRENARLGHPQSKFNRGGGMPIEKFGWGVGGGKPIILYLTPLHTYLHWNDDRGSQLSGRLNECGVFSDNGWVNSTAHKVFFLDGPQLLVERGDTHVSTGQHWHLTRPWHKAPYRVGVDGQRDQMIEFYYHNYI